MITIKFHAKLKTKTRKSKIQYTQSYSNKLQAVLKRNVLKCF